MTISVAAMTRTAILAAIRDDGFELPLASNPRAIAESVQRAARAGCLHWGADRLVSTLEGHPLDLRRVRPARR
jgi:hypothetical protein